MASSSSSQLQIIKSYALSVYFQEHFVLRSENGIYSSLAHFIIFYNITKIRRLSRLHTLFVNDVFSIGLDCDFDVFYDDLSIVSDPWIWNNGPFLFQSGDFEALEERREPRFSVPARGLSQHSLLFLFFILVSNSNLFEKDVGKRRLHNEIIP